MTHPRPPIAEADNTRARLLAAYDLTLDQDVEVELLVRDGGQTRLLDGRVVDALDGVLVLVNRAHRRVRVPWHAIATIHNAYTPHPANDS